MTTFARNFVVPGLGAPVPDWWHDLLQLWRPAHYPAEAFGLRLAVRDASVNFYRKGRSIARVEYADGRLRAFTHVKYVSPDLPRDLAARDIRLRDPYLRLMGDKIEALTNHPAHRGWLEVGRYAGLPMLQTWISCVDARHVEKEKSLVDDVVGLSPDVIDLEMGQPGTAFRMDMVAIERHEDGRLAVAFWEAKRARDARVRCKGPVDLQSQVPHVLRQLDDYRDFITDNHAGVAVAYQRTAVILGELRAVADQLGPRYPLGATIIDAAQHGLRVQPEARLLVFDDDPTDQAWRSTHHPKLAGTRIQMKVHQPPRRLSWP